MIDHPSHANHPAGTTGTGVPAPEEWVATAHAIGHTWFQDPRERLLAVFALLSLILTVVATIVLL